MSEEDQRNENDANPMNPNSNTAQPEYNLDFIVIYRKKSKRQLKKERKLAREENATMDGSNPETTKQIDFCHVENVGLRDLLIQQRMLFGFVRILHLQTVFLGQLSRDTSEDQIRDFFKQHDIGRSFVSYLVSEVRGVRMMREKETNKFRGGSIPKS